MAAVANETGTRENAAATIKTTSRQREWLQEQRGDGGNSSPAQGGKPFHHWT